MTLARENSLPDTREWRDEGCEFFSACLACPLPRCLEEEPRGRQKLKMMARSRQMAKLKAEGKGVMEIAWLYHVHKRTVQRALAAVKEEVTDA